MKHLNLDVQDERVRQFVLSLELNRDGLMLELGGRPVVRVYPPDSGGDQIDPEKVKQAIVARRDESRELNREWEQADRDVWDEE